MSTNFLYQLGGSDVGFDEVYKELLLRDEQDMGRTHDPLKIVDGAWVVDTSDLSIDQVVNLIVAKVKVMQQNVHKH